MKLHPCRRWIAAVLAVSALTLGMLPAVRRSIAALFVVGASLTPLLDVRPKGVRAIEVDLRATVFLLALATTGVALGIVVRLIRSRRIRKGANVW